MKEKAFEPIKIGYSNQEAEHKLFLIKGRIEKLNECRILFENLGLAWSIDALVDLFNGGTESESKIVQGIQQEVSRISFPGLREKMQQELDNTIMHDFKQLRADVRSYKPDCDPAYLEIKNRAIALTDEGKKAIEDSYIIWASTPEELETWNEATELVERLKKLDERLKPFGIYAISRDDMNRPALIRIATSNPETDPFTLNECNANGLWAGKR